MTTATVSTTVRVLSKKESYLFDGLYAYNALTFDPTTDEFGSMGFGSGYDGPPAEYAACQPDADAATLARANLVARFRCVDNLLAMYQREAEDAAKAIVRGQTVRVVAGRKVAKGTEGVVLWMEDGGFGSVMLGVGERGADGRFAETVKTYVRNLVSTAEPKPVKDLWDVWDETEGNVWYN